MLRAHADAAGGHMFPAEEDIILRELEITGLFLGNTGALPDHLAAGGPRALAAAALTLTNVLAAGSPFRTLQMLKRHPGLLALPPAEAGARVLLLKLLLPSADVADLVYQKPSLLLMDDLREQVGGDLRGVIWGVGWRGAWACRGSCAPRCGSARAPALASQARGEPHPLSPPPPTHNYTHTYKHTHTHAHTHTQYRLTPPRWRPRRSRCAR
ncbi:MAG: hypothetical protein J3K34DRAFT_48360 [Monoraphidium minutum]|nr:MAG: hypothetical protein J3K34DRAFT_48360 [Monoraphidium minutum]